MIESGAGVTLTRIVNSCVLLDFAGTTVLTDPWFTERWHLHRGEPLGMAFTALPKLDAIIVSHFFVNHWDRRALDRYPHKTHTALFVPTRRMARQGRALGFSHVQEIGWGEASVINDCLRLEAVAARNLPGGRNNNYVLDSGDVRVFFGGEAEALEPLRRYREANPAVDIALLPVNGLSVPLKGRIVTGPTQAVEGATLLGASALVAVHDAHADDPLWRFIRRNGSGLDAEQQAHRTPNAPLVVNLPTGQPWAFSR